MPNTVFLDTALRLARAALTGNALPSVQATLLTRLAITAKFMAAGVQHAIDTGTAKCVIKPKDAPSGTAALIDTSAVLTGTGETTEYKFEWTDADSVKLREVLDAAGEPYNPIELRAEIEYELSGEKGRIAFPIYFQTAYLRPEDPAPEATADSSLAWLVLHAIRYYPSITGLTGGGSTKLDGIATTTLAARTLVHLMREVEGYQRLETWRLAASTAAEDEAGLVIRPDDYHATTNAKVWFKLA
jgi:hypothetical protein